MTTRNKSNSNTDAENCCQTKNTTAPRQTGESPDYEDITPLCPMPGSRVEQVDTPDEMTTAVPSSLDHPNLPHESTTPTSPTNDSTSIATEIEDTNVNEVKQCDTTHSLETDKH